MPRKKVAMIADSTDSEVPRTPNNTPNDTPMPSPIPLDLIPDDLPDLKVWQAKTLKNTKRTPLPAAPHDRPWIGLKGTELKRAINKSFDNAREEEKTDAEAKGKKRKRTRRRVWMKEEIEKLVEMKENGADWEEIGEEFPLRSDEGLKQIWWKYNYRETKIGQQEKRGLSIPSGSEIDMDINADAFGKDGKVKWNFKRKAS